MVGGVHLFIWFGERIERVLAMESSISSSWMLLSTVDHTLQFQRSSVPFDELNLENDREIRKCFSFQFPLWIMDTSSSTITRRTYPSRGKT